MVELNLNPSFVITCIRRLFVYNICPIRPNTLFIHFVKRILLNNALTNILYLLIKLIKLHVICNALFF